MRRRRTLAACIAVVTAWLLAGCGAEDAVQKAGAAADPAPSASTPTDASSEPAADADMVVEFQAPSTAPGPRGTVTGGLAARDGMGVEELAQLILDLGEVEGIAEGFSSQFVIPEALKVEVVSGDVGPNYDPATRTVTLSYGFANLTGEIIAADQPQLTEEQFGARWAAVNDFILIHEIAHAFVDVLGIPITGREEDAADGMATYFYTDFVEGGADFAFAAAQFFAALQQVQGELDAASYADEHSLSIQRAGDIACKVAGASEQNLRYISQLGVLPDARLQRCPSEYEQMSSAWRTLLTPHVAPG